MSKSVLQFGKSESHLTNQKRDGSLRETIPKKSCFSSVCRDVAAGESICWSVCFMCVIISVISPLSEGSHSLIQYSFTVWSTSCLWAALSAVAHEHQRAEFLIGRKAASSLSSAWSFWPLLSAGFCSACIISSGLFTVDHPAFLERFIIYFMHGRIVAVSSIVPQDSMADQFAWWKMTGPSPHHYSLIRFLRATRSGKQWIPHLAFRSLQSPITKINQVFFPHTIPIIHFWQLCFQQPLRSLGKRGVIFLLFTPQQFCPRPGGMNWKSSLRRSACHLRRKRTKRTYVFAVISFINLLCHSGTSAAVAVFTLSSLKLFLKCCFPPFAT